MGLQDYLYITCRSLHRHLCKLRNCCKVCYILVHVTTRMTFTIVIHGMWLCFDPLKLVFKRLENGKNTGVNQKTSKKIVSLRREWQKYVNYDKKNMKKSRISAQTLKIQELTKKTWKKSRAFGANGKNTGVRIKIREKIAF